TTHELANMPIKSLKDLVEPSIEPEIMFGLKVTPLPGMNEAALLDCIEWVSLGYEIVQSVFPDWKFAASDAVAANGVHGALIIGARHAIAPRKVEWQRELATFGVELYCNGKLIQRGGGARAKLSGAEALIEHLQLVIAK